MKLIEDIWVAKSAHITHLEATQDRLTSESAKALLQKQINIRLHSTSEWMKKNCCSVNWFAALQQLTFLSRLSIVHLSLYLIPRSLLIIHWHQWVCLLSILHRHHQRPLRLCRLLPVRFLLRHLSADLVLHIVFWDSCSQTAGFAWNPGSRKNERYPIFYSRELQKSKIQRISTNQLGCATHSSEQYSRKMLCPALSSTEIKFICKVHGRNQVPEVCLLE